MTDESPVLRKTRHLASHRTASASPLTADVVEHTNVNQSARRTSQRRQGQLGHFAAAISILFGHVVTVAAQGANCIQDRSVIDPISAAFTALVINAWGSVYEFPVLKNFFNDNDGVSDIVDDDDGVIVRTILTLIVKLVAASFIFGSVEYAIAATMIRFFGFLSLTRSGLTRHQAALVVRNRLLVTEPNRKDIVKDYFSEYDIKVDGLDTRTLEFSIRKDYRWLVDKKDTLIPSDDDIRGASGSSTFGSVIAALQAIWGLINGIERLAHHQSLSGLDAIGLQYGVLSAIIAAEAILIPKINNRGIGRLTEADSSDADAANTNDGNIEKGKNDFVGVRESIAWLNVFLVVLIVGFGGWLQTRVDFPTQAIRDAALICYAVRGVLVILNVCIVPLNGFARFEVGRSSNGWAALWVISGFFITVVTIGWVVLCFLGINRPEILERTHVAFNWPHL